LAWDIFNNGKTAFRAGLGQFFLRERVSPVVAALTGNPPFVRGVAGQRTMDGSVFNLDNPNASIGNPRFSWDPRATTPYSWQFNLTIDQEVWEGAVLEVAYVGNRARNQLTHYDINAVLPQNRLAAAFAPDAGAVNALRPFTGYASIYQFSRRGRADYDSLQVLFKTRFSRYSQLQMAYTFSRSKADFGLSDSSGTNSQWALQDINNPDLDFGLSDINRPHLFVANAIFNLPNFNGSNPFVKTILGGWEVATIVQLSSGTSLTPIINATGISYDPDGPGPMGVRNFQAGISGIGTGVANQRPNRNESVSCSVGDNDPTRFINPDAFTLVGYRIGEFGTAERGACLGSPIKNVDLSFYKNFSPSWLKKSFFGESSRIQFRLEVFNLFNTPQFRGDSIGTTYFDGLVECGNDPAVPCSPTNPVITRLVGNSGRPNLNFGVAGSTRGGREIQYALKFIF
jgi:hypothetical protein